MTTDFTEYMATEYEITNSGKTIIKLGNYELLKHDGTLLIAGAAKSRKTTLAVELAHQSKLRVCFIDTEQSKSDGKWIIEVFGRENVLFLAGRGPDEMRRVVNEVSATNTWDLLVIDPIAKLVDDVNGDDVNTLTLLLSHVNKRMPVISVIHTNRGDKNPNGRLGHELEKLCQVTAIISHTGNTSRINCKHIRWGNPFDPFTIDSNRNIILGSAIPCVSKSREYSSKEKHRVNLELITTILGSKEMRASDLYKAVAKKCTLSFDRASKLAKACLMQNTHQISSQVSGREVILRVQHNINNIF